MISISTVINVSVSAAPAGLAPYNINNLACFTKDTPVVSMGSSVYKTYNNTVDVLTDWGSASAVYAAAVDVFSQSPNILSGGGVFIVCPMVALETLSAAISRLSALVFFGGCAKTFTADITEINAAAATAQSLSKLLFIASSVSTDLDAAGQFYVVQAAKQTMTRCVFHTDATQTEHFKWAYASRSMSTNFEAPNSTQTMDMKQLANVLPDEGMTSTLLGKCVTVGADVYVDIATRPTCRSNGSNEFFDNVYNLNWFVATVLVDTFNALATTSSKIPQTEDGQNVLKGAVRGVCERAISNRFVGPGQWNGSDTFGNPEDFRRNIGERGYYIYSTPVALQSQTNRDLRKSQPVMCAIKYQGAIHSADIIILVNK